VQLVHALVASRMRRVTRMEQQGTSRVSARERESRNSGALRNVSRNGLYSRVRPEEMLGGDQASESTMWLDAVRSICPCSSVEATKVSRSAVTRPKGSRLPTGMRLQAAHPWRSPILIGLQAQVIGTSNWRIYRNRACVRFHFSHLPSLLFTWMRSPLRYMEES
jgi:hypothetical protein